MRTGGKAPRAAAPALAAALAVLAAALLLLTAACSSSSSSSSGPSTLSGSIGGNPVTFLKTLKTVADGTVVTDGTGYTLYWFSRDTPTSSACDDTCIPEWPPVTGAPEVAAGSTLRGQLGTFTRSDGVVQATYDGHPLYTFAGDFDPGDVGGNGVLQFGGSWHAVRPG
jgi:predicted lipoprotein with Yx(FWY)xxD motif